MFGDISVNMKPVQKANPPVQVQDAAEEDVDVCVDVDSEDFHVVLDSVAHHKRC